MSTARRFNGWAAALFMVISGTVQAQQPNPYFTGDGGMGIRLAVLEPSGMGLSEEDRWMLSLVQGSITGDFNRFSGMTIIDRQNLEKVLGEWQEATSGKYSNDDYIRIGNLANASHILTGNISKTPNALVIEFSVTDLESGERKASYSPKQVSVIALENLSAVKAASADLLTQLGVNLTSVGLEELKRVEDAAKIQAGAMLARGIAAQRNGTEVTALSYFLQAAALDTTLLEAANRSSILSVNISSGNIGDDTRNEIKWRKDWIARLTETEESFYRMIKTSDPPYTLFYSTDMARGEINYQKETTTFSFLVNLNANAVWFSSLQTAVQAVCDGINATGKKDVWGFSDWPRKGVSKPAPFSVGQQYSFSVAFELVNERGLVIGKQTVNMGTSFRFYTDRGRIMVEYPEDIFKTVIFNAVNANEISDVMTIRIASVNGANPENVRIQITALSDLSDARRLSRRYDAKLEEDKRKDLEAKWKEKNGRMICGSVRLPFTSWYFNTRAIDPLYKFAIGVASGSVEYTNKSFEFFHIGADLEVAGLAIDSVLLKKEYPKAEGTESGFMGRAGVLTKFYFLNTVYLSGGAGWGFYNEKHAGSISAPVLSIGAGFLWNDVYETGVRYNMVLLDDRTRGYWSVIFMGLNFHNYHQNIHK
jgi:hypothetical protein